MKAKKAIKKTIISIAVLIFWLLVWYAAAKVTNLNVLLPTPSETFKKLLELMQTGEYWLYTARSLLRVFTGLISAIAAGAIFGAICAKFRPLDALLSPLVTVLKCTPVSSFIIIALVWLGRDILPSVISFIMVFPVVYGNIKTGISEIDPKHLSLAKVFMLSPVLVLTKIIIPSVMPYFVSAIQTSLGLAWKAGIAAEVLCARPNDSIGGELNQSRIFLETSEMFAWTITIIILSIIIETLFKTLIARFADRRRRSA